MAIKLFKAYMPGDRNELWICAEQVSPHTIGGSFYLNNWDKIQVTDSGYRDA